MTCIAGLVHEHCVYIGGDSAGSSGWDVRVRTDRKVVRNGPLLIGFTGSYRAGQLLQYTLAPPDHPDTLTAMAYLATRFVDVVRDCFKAGGVARKDNEQESGCPFLVGYRGHLYSIGSDYQIAENVDPYDAVGCGEAVALGALYATPHLAPEPRLLLALAASERFNNGVRAPFYVERQEEGDHAPCR